MNTFTIKCLKCGENISVDDALTHQIEDGLKADLKKEQEELELKWKQIEENQFKLMSTDEKVKRMFALNSFGVYNCDKPSLYPKGVSCLANLTHQLYEK